MKTYRGMEIFVHALFNSGHLHPWGKALMPIAWEVVESPELLWML